MCDAHALRRHLAARPSAARGVSRTAGDVIEGFAWTYDRNGNPLSRVRHSDTRGNNDFDELYHESGDSANGYTHLNQIQYWLRGEITGGDTTRRM